MDRALEEGQIVVQAVEILRAAHLDDRQIGPEGVLEQIEIGKDHQRQQPEGRQRHESGRQRPAVAGEEIPHAEAPALPATLSSASTIDMRRVEDEVHLHCPAAAPCRHRRCALRPPGGRPWPFVDLDIDEIPFEGDIGHRDGNAVKPRRRDIDEPRLLGPHIELGRGAAADARPQRDAKDAAAAAEDRPGASVGFDLALEDIVLADEGGDEAVGGAVVDLLRRGHLLEPAMGHHRHPVGHGERLALIVGDVDEGDIGALLDGAQLGPHVLAQLEVERRQRFIEQHDLGLDGERARDGDALLLAARELADGLVGRARQVDQAQQFLGLGRCAPACRRRAPRGRRRCSPRPASGGRAPGSGRSGPSGACWGGCRGHPRRRCGSCPRSASMKPEIIRRIVVLPQPEGPRKEKNSPGLIATSTLSTARKLPKSADTPLRSTPPLIAFASPLPSRMNCFCRAEESPTDRRAQMPGGPCEVLG